MEGSPWSSPWRVVRGVVRRVVCGVVRRVVRGSGVSLFYFPACFVPANKISPKFKLVHESFLSPKVFSAEVKRFFVISLSL